MSDMVSSPNNSPGGNSKASPPALPQQSKATLTINDTIRAIKARGEMLTQHEEQIGRIGAAIEALDLHEMPTLTTQDLAVLTRCCPNVRRLAIKQSKLSSASIAELGKFSKLVALDIGATMKTINFQNIALSAEQIGVLVRNCPHVTNVKLKNCGLTEAHIEELSRFSKLETIDLSDNPAIVNIVRRCQQLAKASIETKPLTQHELLRLAYFIEVRLPAEVSKGISVFTKKAYKLPRSLQHSKKEGGAAYLLANHKISKIKAFGASKLVSSAARLSLKEYSQAPLPFVRGLTRNELLDEGIDEVMQEARLSKKLAQEIQKRFPGEPLGFVPVHTVRLFKNSGSVSRVSLMSPAFDGDYYTFLQKQTAPLARSVLIQLANGASRGLYQLHTLGYAFGDFKNENCVYRENPVTHEIEDARLIDLGFVFCPTKEDPKHDSGVYGTPEFTSPEQFGVIPFKGDFMKADIFAFGVSFYMQFHRKPPPWVAFLQEQWKAKDAAQLPTMQAKVRQSVEEAIEKPFGELQKKAQLTPDEQLQYLIYQTLRLDPTKRIDMATFRKELAKIPMKN